MNNEQNIDDILKLLRDSVSVENAEHYEQISPASEQNISHEELEEQLKSQYLDSNTTTKSTYESQREYVIDSDFLTELEKQPESDSNAEITEEASEAFEIKEADVSEEADTVVKNEYENTESITDSSISFNMCSDETAEEKFAGGVVVKEETDTAAFEEESSQTVIFDTDESFDDTDVYENNIESDIELIDNEESDDVFDNGDLSKENIDGMIAQLENVENDISIDENIGDVSFEETEETDDNTDEDAEFENIVFSDERIDDDLFEIEETASEEIEEHAHHETFLASMRKTGMDFTTDDIYKSTHEMTDEEEHIDDIATDNVEGDAAIEISEEDVASDELDMSTINLMMQFCEKEEFEDTIGNSKVEEFLIYEQTEEVEHTIPEKVLDGKEYVSESQNEKIIELYKKNRMSAMWSMIGCAAIALIAFIYELLPILDVSMSGAFDFSKYPAVYALLGLQFLVFAAAICHKQLWMGLKRAFSFTPNTHSIVAIILALTAVYDLIIVIVLTFTGDDLPPMYNGVAVIITAIVALSEYLDILSEERAFGIYSASASKYTLLRETAKTGIGSKMYGGGLETSKVVYSAHSVDFPRGFFRSVNAKSKKNTAVTIAIIPVIVVGMIAAIVSVVLGSDAYASCAAFMLALYAILPISLILSDSVSNIVASVRLSKRGSAVAGRSAMDTYSECDIMVFDDTHLFKKCKTDEVGFAIYDTSVGYLALGCLDALFAHIGGPLSGMKMESLPDVFRFKNVKVKRIARNGVEAVIENRHSLIVGDHEFMKRYGLIFPENEAENGRSTLCVSLNGKVTAKLSVKYQAEPVFEMLVERLYAEGVSVAVRTADPLINSKTVANARNIGSSPVSVIHLGVDDIAASRGNYREEADGVVCCQSRLKLAEVLVWLKKIKKVRKLSGLIAAGFSAVGTLALILLVIFGATGFVNQLYVLLYLLLEIGAIGGIMIALLPSKKYFTVDALYEELERAHQKQISKNN